jgi:Protein of unknown function (DUF1569)
MSSEQLSWHPPGKWCAVELFGTSVSHLHRNDQGFRESREPRKTPGVAGPVAQRALTLVVVGFGYMPAGRKAPAMVVPKGLPTKAVRNEIGAKIVAMDAIIGQCEARFGRRVPLLDHPILGPLSGAQWRKLHLVHGQHHLKQLLRLRESTTRQMD